MIKRIIILAFLCMSSYGVYAGNNLGPVDFGLRAGINAQRVSIVNGAKSGIFSLDADSRAGFHIGVVSRINFLTFHLQPEFIYTWNRYRLTSTRIETNVSSVSTVRFHNIEVPLLLGMKFLMLRFQAGPSFTVLNNTAFSSKPGLHSVIVQKPVVSYILGIGVDLFKINIDIRYNGRFSKGTQTIRLDDSDLDYKTRFNSWMFSVAYLF